MRTLPFAAASLLVGAALLVSGCTSSPTPGVAAGEFKAKIVKLDADPCKSWNPCEIRIKTGTTVTWTNDDPIAHDVTFVDGPDKPKSGAPGSLQPGQSWSYKFEKPGTYEWHCQIHHPLMHTPGVSPKLIVE